MIDIVRACPVCDGRKAEVLHSQRFVLSDDKKLAWSCAVVACARCDAAFADTPVTQKEYDELYAERSRYAAGPAAHATEHDRDTSRFREMAAAIRDVVPDPTAHIADVGCANGQMLAALGALGCTRLTGIDPSPGCVAQAGAIRGVEAHVGSLSHIPAGVGPFDLVILSHVLEHVRDLKAALRYLRSFLSSDGVVYVEVPDASRYTEFAWSPFQDFNTEHINHFSLVTLANLLRQCGLRPLVSGAKDILSAPGMPYPAIYWFGRLDPGVRPVIERDHALVERLREYVRVSHRLMAAIDARLVDRLGDGRPAVVWGTGELTAKLLAETFLERARVIAFVDGNPVNHGRTLRGLPILAPADLESSDAVIVVASILHHDSIVRAIRGLGLRNPVLGLVKDTCPTSAS
ncbi:MAG TPA: methyltransferase domain-containing protein [Vicinamibacterales bacterium]|jgi:2-polyprenyl-3-methyl-5-hydroxy-6-metoxy-1,4-benzoquinol methylase|nr:methyltransferase domain-containing protein [Vicinamibacterales bacterium]